MNISTHTPLAGRDFFHLMIVRRETPISTHTPLAGRDVSGLVSFSVHGQFLLTRPLRDVT